MISIVIEPTTLGERGQRYRTTYLGSILVESSRNPEFDACRALLAQGITGHLEIWRAGRSAPDARLDIERGAKLTTEEGDRQTLRIVRWKPHTGEASQNSLFASGGAAPGRPIASWPLPRPRENGGRLRAVSGLDATRTRVCSLSVHGLCPNVGEAGKMQQPSSPQCYAYCGNDERPW
jgi:hypothetical protein